MVYSVQQIKFELLAYIKEFGADFGQWYVGVASDPKATMAQEHKLDLDKDVWIYKQALSFAACRTVQRYFIEKLQTDGRPALSGDDATDCVYMYRKSPTTSP
jgi:hypothetical protein